MRDLTNATLSLTIKNIYNHLIMNYKPYSREWNRRRYLSEESINTYFNDGVDPDLIIDDILDILTEEIEYHRGRAEGFTKSNASNGWN